MLNRLQGGRPAKAGGSLPSWQFLRLVIVRGWRPPNYQSLGANRRSVSKIANLAFMSLYPPNDYVWSRVIGLFKFVG